MNIHFNNMILICRKSEEKIDFSHQISYFHGQISAGKSSIMRLIDYCLGGRLEKTPALSQELISVQLSARIGKYIVLFERGVNDASYVQVTWMDDASQSVTVLAPLRAANNPIWEGEIYNLSDLIFYLAGHTPIKVRKSKLKQESELVRLSFRDIMVYCYLDQDDLDSSFYNLHEPHKMLKSRDAIRYITGFYTDRMNDLEIRLDELRYSRVAKLETIQQIRNFLSEFGYSRETEVYDEIHQVEQELEKAQKGLIVLHQGYHSSTHFVDNLRKDLRALSDRIDDESQILDDLDSRVKEQEALRAELISSKFKLARGQTASDMLTGVSFEFCPVCGSTLKGDTKHEETSCYLCDREITKQVVEDSGVIVEATRRDIDSSIDDLTESVNRHKAARNKQKQKAIQIQKEKETIDIQLNNELTNYDSAFLASSREYERQVATLQERKQSLEKIIRMPEAITQMEKEADELASEMQFIKREMEAEKINLVNAEERIREIERNYLEILLTVGVPGVVESDRIGIDRRTWIPKIFPPDGDAYDFYNAGSGGKKTLLNVCYALAIHKVATEDNLPLPTFLMIDTPMKNIGEDVNEEIFQSFYRLLYDLASGILSQTQFVVVDKQYFPPVQGNHLNVYQRFMSPDEPLISYYRGP